MHTDAPVALKTVKVPDERHLHGLRREIRALSRIRHPGIVRILDQGVQGGLPWYAMELIEGVSLRAREGVGEDGESGEAMELVVDWDVNIASCILPSVKACARACLLAATVCVRRHAVATDMKLYSRDLVSVSADAVALADVGHQRQVVVGI